MNYFTSHNLRQTAPILPYPEAGVKSFFAFIEEFFILLVCFGKTTLNYGLFRQNPHKYGVSPVKPRFSAKVQN